MSRIIRYLLFLIFLAVVSIGISASTSTAAAPRGPLVGGWSPIKDLKDPHVKEIAEFAVAQYNEKAKSHLKLLKVVNGESQVVAGMNYRLVLAVADGKEQKKYEAVVYERAWENVRNLTSFKPMQV